MTAYFDKGHALEAAHLWIELEEGSPIPEEFAVKHPQLFKTMHGEHMFDLTAYVCLLHDIRRF